ncbi:MAG: TlpA disulfide reductase family protein [Gemmatimonadaceae bacterium]
MHSSSVRRSLIPATHAGMLGVAIMVALAVTAVSAKAQDGGIAVGAQAPGAAVESLDGKALDLSHYIGKKPVVLEFWATWCPLCKKLEPALKAAREKYGDRVSFVSVGVNNNQTAARQKAYAEEKHIGGDFVFDRDGKAVAAYKVPHTSYIVVIGADGRVVYTGVGAEQDVEAAVAKAFGTGRMGPGDK